MLNGYFNLPIAANRFLPQLTAIKIRKPPLRSSRIALRFIQATRSPAAIERSEIVAGAVLLALFQIAE
jgi:hypothetical protein